MMKNSLKAKNIIKANGNGKKSSVIKNQVLLAKKEAEQIIADAEEFAEKLRDQTVIDSEETIKKAFEKGTEDALLEFQKNLFEIREIRERVLRETEKDVLRLSVRLAEKIVGKTLSGDKKAIQDIVTTALQNARQKERITIRVNPAELQLVQKEEEALQTSAQAKYLDVVADPRVEKGGCLIESEVGTVDARLETQFRVLERALLAQADGEFVSES